MLTYSPQKIIQLREGRGWNQSELARAAKLSANTIWSYENGDIKMPKFETLRKIAGALGVPLSALMSDDQPSNIDERIAATTGALSPANKAALLAAAQALLESQKGK